MVNNSALCGRFNAREVTLEESSLVVGTFEWSRLLEKQHRNVDFTEDIRLKHSYNKMFKHGQGAKLADVELNDPYF